MNLCVYNHWIKWCKIRKQGKKKTSLSHTKSINLLDGNGSYDKFEQGREVITFASQGNQGVCNSNISRGEVAHTGDNIEEECRLHKLEKYLESTKPRNGNLYGMSQNRESRVQARFIALYN